MVNGYIEEPPACSAEGAETVRVLAGTPALFDGIDDCAAPTLGRMIRSRAESRALTALQDCLLPKLISGELRLTEAERLVSPNPRDRSRAQR